MMPVFYSYDIKRKLDHSVGVSECISNEIVEALEPSSGQGETQVGFVKLIDLECVTELREAEKLPHRLRPKLAHLARKGCKKVVWLLPENPRVARRVRTLLNRLGKSPGQGLHQLIQLANNRQELKALLSHSA